VVLVPQFAQQRAPTVVLAFLLLPTLATLASLSTPALGEAGTFADADSSRGDDDSFSAPSSTVAAASGASDVAFSARAVKAKTLLYVGQPEHALVPPVPSHRPSPGHVPPELVVCGTLPPVACFGIGELCLVLAEVEFVNELGAKGEGPTVLVVAVAAVVDVVPLVVGGEDVRPREDGRGMCLDF